MRELSESSSDESEWNKCFIKINGNFVEVVDGYVTDPNTKLDTKLDFFYLSRCNKMIHMDFEDALIEINASLKRHQCRPTFKMKRRFHDDSDSYSLLLRKIEKLQEEFEKNKCQGCHRHDTHDESSEHVTREGSEKNSSANLSLSSTANRTYLIESSIAESIHMALDTEDLSLSAQPLSESQLLKRRKRQASFYISADDLRIIGKWASKNRDFLPYKGMEEVPKGLFETDDEYFFKLIFSLNPTVVLDRNLPKLTKSRRKICTTPRNNSSVSNDLNEMSLSEFARNLGLVHNQSVNSNLGSSPRTKSKICRQLDQAYELHDPKSAGNQNNGMDFNTESNKENSNGTSTLNKNLGYFSKIDHWRSKRTQKKKDSEDISKRNLRPLKNCVYSKSAINMLRDKMAYTTEEDRIILKWVLRGVNSTKVNGNSIWQKLEQQNVMPNGARTWQSLRNRFLKTILCQLRDYGLNQHEMLVITKGAQKGCIHRKSKEPMHSKNYGLVISKKVSKNMPTDQKTGEKTQSPKKISPSRITYVKRPKSNKQPKANVYSETDYLSDNTPEISLMEYKKKLRESSTNTSQSNTRSKVRKLFTQTTFNASVSDKLSLRID